MTSTIYVLTTEFGDHYYFFTHRRAFNFCIQYLKESLDEGECLDNAIEELYDSYHRCSVSFEVDGVFKVRAAEIDMEDE